MSPPSTISQLWLFILLFILAPIAGALIAGYTYKPLLGQGPVTSLEQATRG